MDRNIIKKSLKSTLIHLKRNHSISNVLWYPHCGCDMNIISSELLKEVSISPELFIMNDSCPQISRIDLSNLDLKVEKFEKIKIDNFLISDNEEIEYFQLRINDKPDIHIIRLLGVDSNDLLAYFLEKSITIDYIFTSRMAGGILLNLYGMKLDLFSNTVRTSLNYSYLITDLHCITKNLIVDDVVRESNLIETQIKLLNFDFFIKHRGVYKSVSDTGGLYLVLKNGKKLERHFFHNRSVL